MSTVARIADWRLSGSVTSARIAIVSRKVSGFLAGLDIDLSNGDFRAFAGEQNCGGSANPVTGAGDEGYLACEPWHRSLPPDCKNLKQPEAGGSGAIS